MLLLGLVAVIAVVALTAWGLLRSSAITRENARRIQDGMTLAEVEEVLGGPARDESTGPLDEKSSVPGGEIKRCWKSDEVVVWVGFDAGGSVVYHQGAPAQRGPESLITIINRIRRCLGL